MGYFGYAPYVPVVERRRQAKKKIEKLRKKGMDVQPIELEGRKITKTFWGNAWNNHIESFSDYENRLPRGRSYIRNGSVCHLAMSAGKIEAMVSGSTIYTVTISITPLSEKKWVSIKQQCSGKIASLLDLLAGKLSEGVMRIVCDQQTGLFPLLDEIKLSCSCPDGASMCKHVAAVLYGVGARLDDSPHQLFLLRGINHAELVDVTSVIGNLASQTDSKRRHLTDNNLSDVFGIEIDNSSQWVSSNTMDNKRNTFPKRLTGIAIRKKRLLLNLTQVTL